MADESLWAKFEQSNNAAPSQNLWQGLTGADQAAMMPETFANPIIKSAIDGAANLVSAPGHLIQKNPYPSGSESAAWFEDQRSKGISDWAPQAALATMGTGGIAGVPIRAGETVFGSGAVRSRVLPSDNYLGPVSRYTDSLYREMHPSEALIDLPTSVVQGGSGPAGVQRKFYADQPDLALGQGSNKGVKVEYDAAPFEGQINQKKPAWDLAFQNGNAEYLAAPRPGANIRDAVRSFEVDPSSLSRVERAQYQRVISNLADKGWDIKRTPDKIIVSKPSS